MFVGRNSGPSFIVRRRSRRISSAHPTNPPASTDNSSLHTSKAGGQSEKSMIFPRSSHYERLEGGLGPSRLGVRNIAWRRIVLGLTLIVGFFWLVRHSQKTVWSVKTPGEPFQTFAAASVIAHNGIEGKNHVLQCGKHPWAWNPTLTLTMILYPLRLPQALRLPWSNHISPKWMTPPLPQYLPPILPDHHHTNPTQIQAKPSSAPLRTTHHRRSYNMPS